MPSQTCAEVCMVAVNEAFRDNLKNTFKMLMDAMIMANGEDAAIQEAVAKAANGVALSKLTYDKSKELIANLQ